MVSILNNGHWMWVFRAERSIIGLHTPERADCKSQETESIRLLFPLSSSFPSRLSEGPSFSLDSDKEPERLDEKEVGWGDTPPIGSLLPIGLLRFWPTPPKRRRACLLLKTEIGPKSEAWKGGPNTRTVEGERSGVSLALFPLTSSL